MLHNNYFILSTDFLFARIYSAAVSFFYFISKYENNLQGGKKVTVLKYYVTNSTTHISGMLSCLNNFEKKIFNFNLGV